MSAKRTAKQYKPGFRSSNSFRSARTNTSPSLSESRSRTSSLFISAWTESALSARVSMRGTAPAADS